MAPFLATTTEYFKPEEEDGIPGIVVHVISAIETYAIWAGTTDNVPPEDTTKDRLIQQGNLANDWACSIKMTKPSMPIATTTLLRTTKDSVAFAMSQRLAQRFKKQIFLSIDISTAHSTGLKAPLISMALEKRVGTVLRGLEAAVQLDDTQSTA